MTSVKKGFGKTLLRMGRTGREGRSEVRVGGAIVPNQYEACAYRMSVDLVLKQGYLVKAPTSVGHREYSGKAETVLSFVKRNHRRYFVLDAGLKLSYYESENAVGKNPKGSIQLGTDTQVLSIGKTTLLVTPHQHSDQQLYIVAPSEEECLSWKKEIIRQTKNAKTRLSFGSENENTETKQSSSPRQRIDSNSEKCSESKQEFHTKEEAWRREWEKRVKPKFHRNKFKLEFPVRMQGFVTILVNQIDNHMNENTASVDECRPAYLVLRVDLECYEDSKEFERNAEPNHVIALDAFHVGIEPNHPTEFIVRNLTTAFCCRVSSEEEAQEWVDEIRGRKWLGGVVKPKRS